MACMFQRRISLPFMSNSSTPSLMSGTMVYPFQHFSGL